MKLIVGLGTPGKEYEGTRHNMGFMAIDALAEMIGCDLDRHDFKGTYGILRQHPSFSEPIALLKPETFMNLSGESVQPFMAYFKIPLEDLIVIYDDMAIEEGKIRLRPFGSAGSHNGMKSIIQCLGSDRFKRIRIGIGEPVHTGVDYVLSKPTGESLAKTQEGVQTAAKAVRDFLLHDWNYAMNHFNQ